MCGVPFSGGYYKYCISILFIPIIWLEYTVTSSIVKYKKDFEYIIKQLEINIEFGKEILHK